MGFAYRVYMRRSPVGSGEGGDATPTFDSELVTFDSDLFTMDNE